MKKFYLAMIVDEDVMNDLGCYSGDRIEFIGEPIEITSEDLERMSEAINEN